MATQRKPYALKSGARVYSEEVPYEYRGPLGRAQSSLTIVPMAKRLDTTGASSASEVYRSNESINKWYAKSQSRPLTEIEYNEYMRNRESPYRRMAILRNNGEDRVNRRGMFPQLMIRRSYQDYLNVAAGRSGSSSTSGPLRLGVGGGTRSTGLGY